MPRRAPTLEEVVRPLRHELRNTLTPIAMIVDVLALTAQRPEHDILARDVRRLGVILDDLCELASALDAPLAMAKRPLALAKIVAAIVEDMTEQLSQVGGSLAVTIPAELRVTADPTWLPVALASILRHVTTASARLELTARRAGASIQLTLRTAPAPLPDERALAFARRLVELQGGRWIAGDDLRLSLPASRPIG